MGKKSKLLFFALFIFVSMIYLAQAELIVSRQECKDGLTFVIENTGGYQFRPKDFLITGTTLTGKQVKFDGIWKNLADYPALQTSGRQFLSNNSFPMYGTYKINVTRVKQNDQHFDKEGNPEIIYQESTEFDIVCEEQPFECSKINLKIDECYTANGRYYGVFSGIGNQKEFTYDRFSFKFVGRGHIYANESPRDISFNQISEGKYYVSFPADAFTGWTTVNIIGCDDQRYGRTYAKDQCRVARECTDDSQCKEYEYCNTDKGGVCEILLCGPCKKPKNGACVDKCNDENICTQDTCIEGACFYENINGCCKSAQDCGQNTLCKTNLCLNNRCALQEKECTQTNDTCIIGKCSEEKGCIYNVDPSCKMNAFEKFINWFIDFFRR